MKTDTQTSNENASPNSRELLILKKYFPQCFSKKCHTDLEEDVFDIEKFTEILKKGDIDIKKEGYALNFLGKSYAHYQANLDSETVIVPDEKNAETESENVYIVGDNLDALQHLKYSYAEKIKCIYIDPPYNTGKDDFVYNDKFGFTAKELEEKLDVSAEEAERIVSMNGKCTHSAWLTFMYPRLALARELLRDDGVIFISIDDNEQANLKLLCDEVFGEGNFVANIAWKRKKEISNDSNNVAIQGETILIYQKSTEASLNLEPLTEEYIKNSYYDPTPEFPEDKWRPVPLTVSKGLKGGGYKYEIKTPSGITHLRTWAYPETGYKKLLASKKVFFGKNNDAIPQRVMYLKESKGQPVSNYWDNTATNKEGKKEILEIFGENYFDTPKPTKLIKRILKLSTQSNRDSVGISNPCDNSGGVAGVSPAERVAENAKAVGARGRLPPSYDENLSLSTDNCPLILDFFSGSGTTAHAVMDLNAKDGGKRKFIMVQMDESVKKGSEAEKAGFRTIDQIGRERIRRAAAKIKAENPGTTADLGFKTYYLKSMPKETLDKIKTFNPNELISSDGDIVKSLGAATVLQTWQIKDGFGFNAKPQKIDLAGYSAYLFDDEKIGKYLYLLEEIEEKSIKELVRKIEGFELAADKIFLYGYSFDFDALNSITTNLKTLKNRNPIEPIVRY